MSLSGFSVALADKGGAYRTRAGATLALTFIGAVAASVGALAGPNAVVSVAVVALWAGGASLIRVLGSGATSVGASSSIILVVSLAAPATSLTAALLRGGWVLLGGLWATLVSLVFWPLRPYRPLRLTLAAVYRQLASHAEHVARGEPGGRTRPSPDDGPPAWEDERRTLRQLLETAREQVVASRRRQPQRSERGERMLVLVELADQLFGGTIAAAELLALEPAVAPDDGTEPRRSLLALANQARAIADALVEERELRRPTAPLFEARADTEAATIGARIAAYLRVAVHTTATIEHPGATLTEWPEPTVESGPSARDLLRSTLEPDSLTLRHALRVAITVGVAVALTHVLTLGRGYWLTLTVLIVMQPQTGATLLKVVQRVLGTVVGAAITALIVSLLPSPTAILVLIVVLIVVCVSLLPVNYFLYSVALTPTFVLLAELSAGDWHLAGLRVENTLLGGALALVGSWLLWPSSERSKYPELQRNALVASRDHLREIARLWTDGSPESSRQLAIARRRVALATANAETALDAMLAASIESNARFEARMALLTGVRRLVSADTALAAMRSAPSSRNARAEVERLAFAVSGVLDDLASAILETRRPAPFRADLAARVFTGDAPDALRRLVERIVGQLAFLRDAVERVNDGDATAKGIGRAVHASYIG